MILLVFLHGYNTAAFNEKVSIIFPLKIILYDSTGLVMIKTSWKVVSESEILSCAWIIVSLQHLCGLEKVCLELHLFTEWTKITGVNASASGHLVVTWQCWSWSHRAAPPYKIYHVKRLALNGRHFTNFDRRREAEATTSYSLASGDQRKNTSIKKSWCNGSWRWFLQAPEPPSHGHPSLPLRVIKKSLNPLIWCRFDRLYVLSTVASRARRSWVRTPAGTGPFYVGFLRVIRFPATVRRTCRRVAQRGPRKDPVRSPRCCSLPSQDE